MSDPVLWRGLERLVVCLGAISFGYLGYRLYRFGIAEGKSKVEAESELFKIAVSGAGPGVLFMALGAIVLMVALFQGGAVNQGPAITAQDAPSAEEEILDVWLERSNSIRQEDSFDVVLNRVVGTTPFFNRSVPVRDATTLGALAKSHLGDAKYWRLLAVLNKDKGYFTLGDASAETMVAAGGVIDVMMVARAPGPTIGGGQRVAGSLKVLISGADKTRFYEHLLELRNAGEPFNFAKIDDLAKDQQLGLHLKQVVVSAEEGETLNEVGLAQYGAKRFWPLISWSNPGLPEDPAQKLPVGSDLLVPVIIP